MSNGKYDIVVLEDMSGNVVLDIKLRKALEALEIDTVIVGATNQLSPIRELKITEPFEPPIFVKQDRKAQWKNEVPRHKQRK